MRSILANAFTASTGSRRIFSPTLKCEMRPCRTHRRTNESVTPSISAAPGIETYPGSLFFGCMGIEYRRRDGIATPAVGFAYLPTGEARKSEMIAHHGLIRYLGLRAPPILRRVRTSVSLKQLRNHRAVALAGASNRSCPIPAGLSAKHCPVFEAFVRLAIVSRYPSRLEAAHTLAE